MSCECGSQRVLPFFSGREGVSVASIHVLCPVGLEEQLASSSSTKWSARSGIHARTQSP